MGREPQAGHVRQPDLFGEVDNFHVAGVRVLQVGSLQDVEQPLRVEPRDRAQRLEHDTELAHLESPEALFSNVKTHTTYKEELKSAQKAKLASLMLLVSNLLAALVELRTKLTVFLRHLRHGPKLEISSISATR